MQTDHEKFDADKRLRQAVLELRTRLSLTQTQFGQALGKSLNSIQRWETVTAPKAKALAKLIQLATRKSQPDLAETFRKAMKAEVGIEVVEFRPEDQVIADAFFAMAESPEKWKHVREAVERDLAPIIAEQARRALVDEDGEPRRSKKRAQVKS